MISISVILFNQLSLLTRWEKENESWSNPRDRAKGQIVFWVRSIGILRLNRDIHQL